MPKTAPAPSKRHACRSERVNNKPPSRSRSRSRSPKRTGRRDSTSPAVCRACGFDRSSIIGTSRATRINNYKTAFVFFFLIASCISCAPNNCRLRSRHGTRQESSRLARPDLGSDYSRAEFTRPENNVLNLREVLGDFLVGWSRKSRARLTFLAHRDAVISFFFFIFFSLQSAARRTSGSLYPATVIYGENRCAEKS